MATFYRTGFPEEYYHRFYRAVTGVALSMEGLLERSRHVYDLSRTINVHQGISRKDGYPPERTFQDPVPVGPTAGKMIDREEYEKILDLDYERQGWDKEGKPQITT